MQSSPAPPGSSQKAPQILPDINNNNNNNNSSNTKLNTTNINSNTLMGMNQQQQQQPNPNMNGVNNMSWMFNQGFPPNTMNNGGAAAGGLNPNDLNSVMNAMLMNNALQQQQQQQVQQQQQQQQQNNMMNPLLLQTMLNQGMIPNAYGSANSTMGQMTGLNNPFQQGMMNPAAMAGMMGGLVNGGGSVGNTTMGMEGNGGMAAAGSTGGGGSASANFGNFTSSSSSQAKGVGGSNTNAESEGQNNNIINNNDLFLQLMSNPLAAQMISQGLNPMMLLGASGAGMGMGGMVMGQNQFGGLGFGGIGGANRASDTAAGGSSSFNPMMNVTAMDPNTLFALNHPGAAAATTMPRGIASMMGASAEDGVLLKHAMANSKAGEKPGKKIKVKGKPKRPLSAYNFFFREERARILDNLPKGKGTKDGLVKKEDEDDETKKEDEKEDGMKKKRKGMKDEEKADDDEDDSSTTNDDGEEHTATAAGEKDYDQVGADGKKIPHGKIGFESLAKQIGKRWQTISSEDMERFKALADEDMTRYKREMEAFLNKEVPPAAVAGLPVDGMTMAHHSMFGMLNQLQHQPLAAKKPKSKRKEGGDTKPRKKRGSKKGDNGDEKDEKLI
jgi:hypothetical protein